MVFRISKIHTNADFTFSNNILLYLAIEVIDKICFIEYTIFTEQVKG